MAYTSQGFADGQVLSAAKLTNIENAILDNDVIASGTSGGWNYIKYANGMAILYATFSESISNSGTYINTNIYTTSAHTFPFTFVSEPAAGYGGYVGSGYAINGRLIIENNSLKIQFLCSATGTQTVISRVVVIGRWK